MTAKPLPVDVSETMKMKTNSSKNNSENIDGAVDDATDFHAARIVSSQDFQSTFDLLSAVATPNGNASQRLKKSSFQITRIVQADMTGDNAEDTDDVTSTEDFGSSLEGAKQTNSELDARSIDTTHSPSSVEEVESSPSCQKHLFPNPSHLVRTRPSDINSRFKIVKIESNKPLRKGRWICFEFVDPPQFNAPVEKTVKCNDTESMSSVITSPIYYIPVEKEDPLNSQFAAAIVYSDGHLSLEPNPIPFAAESATCQSHCSIVSESLVMPPFNVRSNRFAESSKETSSLSTDLNNRESTLTKSSDQQPIPFPYVVHPQMLNSLQEEGRSTLVNGVMCASDDMIGSFKNDSPHVTVIRTGSEPSFVHSKVSDDVSSPLIAIVPPSINAYACGLVENDISEEICALDSKIEQAMDLVKNHLMFAVHEEVELLKDQINKLTIKKGQLEYENKVLRASATQETLEKLHHGGGSSTTLS